MRGLDRLQRLDLAPGVHTGHACMKILVTGHEGYLGCDLVPRLMRLGHFVRGMDAGYFTQCAYFPVEGPHEVVRKDIREARVEDLQGFEVVIHLAALSNDPLGDFDPELTNEINHYATVRLALLAREAGVRRFIFSSSCSAYGAAGEDWAHECYPVNPVTPYGMSKVRAEMNLARLATDDFCPVSLRNATVYGVSARMRFDLVLNNLVAWAYTTGKVFLKSDGSAWRPLVHVEDVSRAFIAFLEMEASLIRGEAFNVGRSAENFRVRDLAQLVQDELPGCAFVYGPEAGRDPRNYRVSFARIEREIPCFQPKWTVAGGVRELLATFRENGLKADDFEGPRYLRLAHLKARMARGELDHKLRLKNKES
ncbi:MAG: hypothetical protein RL648_1709 [Verrucomicrobiota bacterium]